jgi:putative ABC transport system permease protein
MTLLMVGGGVTGLLLSGGFFAFMVDGLREHTIQEGLGHLQIFTAEHFRRDEVRVLDTGIDNWRQVAATIQTGPHVRGVAPRIEFYGMVSNGTKSSIFMGSAVDPAAESSLGFTPRLSSGSDLSPKPAGEVEALIGSGLAKSMNVKVGDGLTILAVTSDGALNGVDVQVAGIVKTGYDEMDARYLRVTLASAQRLLQSDRVTNLVVGLDSTANTDAAAAALTPRLQGLPQQMVLKKWIDLATYYLQVRNMFFGIFLFLGVIVFFMVLMASVNTLLMAMFERTREIGTMLAMGTPRFWIVTLFMLEATLTGCLGAIAGVLGGNLLGAIINASGLHMPPPPGLTVPIDFHVLHIPVLMVASSFIVIFSLALASIFPAIRASRLQIAEALAHV